MNNDQRDVYEVAMALLAAFAMLVIVLLIFGCSPFIGYSHLSDPGIQGDGSDLVCAGVKLRDEVELTVGGCKNLRGGQMLRIDAEYVWDEE